MASTDKPRPMEDGPGQGPKKPAKRQRKVAFADDIGLEPSDCITLHLVSLAEEMDVGTVIKTNAPSFSPDFTERFFGDDGKIFGYTNLKIDVWLHALSFHAYVDIQYSERVQDAGCGRRFTDLHHIFKDIFKAGLIEDRETFVRGLSSNNLGISQILHHHGELIVCWTDLEDGELGTDSSPFHIEKKILRLGLNNDEIREWHARLTPLALMFIEAGRPIEQEDPRWEVYVIIQKVLDSVHENPWKLAGFSNVYQFYHYPESTRLRISQILVFPPYQGKQNGLRLLETVNTISVQRQCYDVTMEEPSESLQELRDCMDVIRLLSFQPARSAIRKVLTSLKAIKNITNHRENGAQLSRTVEANGSHIVHAEAPRERTWLEPATVLVEEARKQLKITKMQLQRCWEVLLFMHLRDCEAHAQDAFRKLLVWRLKMELFGKANDSQLGHGKLVVDTENQYDSSKTFVMAKVRHIKQDGVVAGNMEEHLQDTVEIDGKTDLENLQEILEERLGEVERVTQKVALHCTSLGISLADDSAQGNNAN